MKVVRVVSSFDKKTEKLVEDFEIDLDLEILKIIFNPPNEDPLMYNPYWITEKAAESLKGYVNVYFDFVKYDYDLCCFQINE